MSVSMSLVVGELNLKIIEHGKWEAQIEAWQRPIVEDKRLPEW